MADVQTPPALVQSEPPLESKSKAEAQHLEHVETVSVPPPADASKLKDIETVALVVDEAKADFKLSPIILDEIRPDEVLVEMKYSGICHTDIVLQQGLLPLLEFPAVLGHEGAGVVRGVGSGVGAEVAAVGDDVLLSFTTCGTCRPCTTSHPAFCHRHAQVNHNAVRLSDGSTPARRPEAEGGGAVRSQYFGHSSFARMSVVNARCVVKCPRPAADSADSADSAAAAPNLELYAPLGCGLQSGCGTVLNVLRPGPEDSIAIFGIGTVGLAALMAARYRGARRIVAVDVVPERLALAAELGATHTVNSREAGEGTAAAVKEAAGEGGANFAIDCTGIPKVIEAVVECLAPEGTGALVGVPSAGSKITIDPLSFLLDNKRFVGVIEGDSNPPDFIPQMVRMHQEGHFPIEKLCKTYPVSRFQDAIRDMHSGKVIKPVIDWTAIPATSTS